MTMRDNVSAKDALDQNRRYHDEIEAPHYDVRMGIDHGPVARARMIYELERVLGRSLPGGCALDVGTGTGNVAIKLALTGRYERMVAIDISEGMLEHLGRAAKEAGVEIESVVTDMRKLPFDDNQFDLVTGCAVLHHLPDPTALMEEIFRVLKPGAPVVIIGEPSRRGGKLIDAVKAPLVLASRIRKKLRGEVPSPWQHDLIDIHAFTTADIRRMTKDFCGLRYVPEGFFGPILGQGWLSPLRPVFAKWPGIGRLIDLVQYGFDALDTRLMNRIVPMNWRSSMKFAANKPKRT
ncbi:MAG: class I SAM-dependent methyltransferase [Pseudomonadota bacterium]|nr:class I SAM-dependent methyltransferase [Pseudomonadota bacterium]